MDEKSDRLLETSISSNAIEVDKALSARVADKGDLLIDYNLVCEISFYTPPRPADRTPLQYSFLLSTDSDWTEPLKGIGDIGSKLSDSRNHNRFERSENALSGEHHCWLFYVLYHELSMEWSEIVRIKAIWSDLEVTHHYCVEI